jgi:uncharacterized protein YcbX
MTKGFQFDRRWMLLDESGKFITQRIEPTLALFKLQWTGTQFNIHFGTDTIALHPEQAEGSVIETRVWDDAVTVQEVSPYHSEWFSDKLKSKHKLVFFPEKNARPVDASYQVNHEHVSLADAYPYLIIGQASLDDLNSRLDDPVPMNRFRPNLVFTGGKPFEEDTWKDFTIGEKTFRGAKPCSRCILITTDQDTAQRRAEPLKTLASYRTRNNKTYFGQNVLALQPGEIKVGDPISVHSYL